MVSPVGSSFGRASACALSLAPLRTALQMRAADAWTIDTVGVLGIVLMEHAGRAVADVVVAHRTARMAQGLDGGVVDVLCGPGNNGGDGWVCARHLVGRGVPVRVLATCGPAELKGDAHRAARTFEEARARHCKETVVVVAPAAELARWVERSEATVVVDALLGTGLGRPLDASMTSLVNAVQQRRARSAKVVAVDVPSGLPADGASPGAAVCADVTVTWGGRKVAHVAEPGFAFCGEVIEVDIGLLHPPSENVEVFALDDVKLSPAAVLAHKNRYGHIGIVAGTEGTEGASLLAARAALRTGAGLVSLLGDDAGGVARPIEVMRRPLDDDGIAALDGVLVGPGLAAEEVHGLVPLLARARQSGRGFFVVADAGAIGALPSGLVDVWTPHPGEAARVLGASAAQVQADRLSSARALVQHLGGVVVCKGAAPVVASASRSVIVPGGVPALAVGGSGDVFAGVVAAVLGGALGTMTTEEAVLVAVWLHQQAGRSLSRGAIASELADAVAPAISRARAS